MDPEDIKVIDENAEFFGISRIQLMENAGKSVAEALLKRVNVKNKNILILAYIGNKGGDGFVTARHLLYHGANVVIILLSRPELISSEEAKRNFSILEKLSSISIHFALHPSDVISLKELFQSADVIIDAMLGTGARGEPREPIKTAIEMANQFKAFKVAIDVPSGVDAKSGFIYKTAFKADLTITHHKPKTGLLNDAAKPFIGELEVANIGIPPDVELYVGPGDLKIAIKKRDIFSHKGDNGRLLIIGGSYKYSGAPALAAMAALKTGIDLAIIAAPSSIANGIRAYSPDLIVRPLPSKDFLDLESLDIIKEESKRVDAIVIGMGLGIEESTISAAIEIIKYLNDIEKPMVIDADALKALGRIRDELKFKKSVLTPHAGEFYALTGERLPDESIFGWRRRLDIVMKWAIKLNATILLKSRYDIITDGNKFKIKVIGNPGMTIGGTGDVLAGMVGALLSRGIEPFKAATASSFLNSYIGDILEAEMGHHYTAKDIVDKIPSVMKKFGL
ncbi:MAG: NAD(P)H-hydrate dehydratase [Candidatus Methanomethyliaceae archaeon]|nr:NAD(P)H-hydrate dehydratase [Candidatus Methanomethyliaceae archaeon]MDW7970782.1 NAD(P)H-hydrate dehydratase [Nitrososphaerota archaeon]